MLGEVEDDDVQIVRERVEGEDFSFLHIYCELCQHIPCDCGATHCPCWTCAKRSAPVKLAPADSSRPLLPARQRQCKVDGKSDGLRGEIGIGHVLLDFMNDGIRNGVFVVSLHLLEEIRF